MPTRSRHTPMVTVEQSTDLVKLEGIVSDFTKSATLLMETDHKKIDLVYDFLFLGQPTADPPVPPFVAQVQQSLSNHTREIAAIRSTGTRFLWMIVGAAIGGAGWFIVTTISHIFGK